MDFEFKLSNDQKINGFIKNSLKNPISTVIMIHGLGEHIRRYDYWADLFHSEGIEFMGADLPGHGNSDGKRGHIKNYDLLYEMIDNLIVIWKKNKPGVPVFLYGQSLGGGIVLNYLLKSNPDIKGAVVTSPWLRLSFEPEKSKLKLAGTLKNILPKLTMPNGLVIDHISRDNQIVKAYMNDPLVHDKISLSLIDGAFKAADESLKNAERLKIPVLLLHGSDDQICSPEGSREFASKTGMAELKIWEGGFHELHNDLIKLEVFDFIAQWIKKKSV